jgi:hypothetical protein
MLHRPGRRMLWSLRGDMLLGLRVKTSSPHCGLLGSRPSLEIAKALHDGQVKRVGVRQRGASGRTGPLIDATAALPQIVWSPDGVANWLQSQDPAPAPHKSPSGSFTETYFTYLRLLHDHPDLIDFVYPRYMQLRRQIDPAVGPQKPPFDQPADLAPLVFPKPRRRSVAFLNNNYFYNNFLASALRRRGWDAVSVSMLQRTDAAQLFMHGQDVDLSDPDPAVMDRNLRQFLSTAAERFGAVHFYGQGVASFFPVNYEANASPASIPWDFMELRRQGVIIGHTPTGCADGPRQSSIRRISGGMCGRCIWELHPEVCSDAKNGAWARKLDSLCDWIALDGDYALDERTGPKYVKEPVVNAMDPQMWRPDIEPPEDMLVEREPGEILVYHAFGNAEARMREGRDVKGTGAVFKAIDELKAEGLPLKLIFASKVPSTKVRYLQVQADIAIDQLNYGRLGSNARECMMLGKPLIARKIATQDDGTPPSAYLLESPVLDASEESIKDVLRILAQSPQDWGALGSASREFAVKWHDADACALRFERIIDRIEAGLAPDSPEVFA